MDEAGRCEGLEPRVMQVLVALAQARGAIVTRDELTDLCWDGRIVGEDALNRVISRLRRLSVEVGGDAFRIETITKVGYRLVVREARAAIQAAPKTERTGPDRRALVIGAGVAAAVIAATAAVAILRARDGTDAEIAPLLYQAAVAIQQGDAQGADQAIGLLRRVIAMRPDNADAWGMLGLCYAVVAQGRAPRLEADLTARSREAVRRAEALRPANTYARVARAMLIPRLGRWDEVERLLQAPPAEGGENQPLLLARADLFAAVGRCREAALLVDRAMTLSPPAPGLVAFHALHLWAAGRLEEADRAMAAAFDLYPTHFAVWFARFHLLLYTGRAQAALAQTDHLDGRPSGVTEVNFALNGAIARAMMTRTRAEVDRAIRLAVAAARQGAGYAENAIQYAAALGRTDTAFEIAQAYFFNSGFAVADLRYSPQQRTYTRPDNRRTPLLFYPSTAPMRADGRFEGLVGRLGLDRYWRQAAVVPDYRRG